MTGNDLIAFKIFMGSGVLIVAMLIGFMVWLGKDRLEDPAADAGDDGYDRKVIR